MDAEERKSANATRLTIRSRAGVTFNKPSPGPKRICHFIYGVTARGGPENGYLQDLREYRAELLPSARGVQSSKFKTRASSDSLTRYRPAFVCNFIRVSNAWESRPEVRTFSFSPFASTSPFRNSSA